MTDATTEFFEALGERGHEPLLEKATGTLRFDITDGRRRKARWFVAIKKGDVTVSHASSKADCVVRLDKALTDRIVTGRENATAAMLRGLVGVEGEPNLLVLFQRLFPGPPKSGKPA